MGVRGRSPRKKIRYSDVKNEILAKYNKFYEYDVEDDGEISPMIGRSPRNIFGHHSFKIK